MKRKVIQIANSTQLISLPRKWVLDHNIKKGVKYPSIFFVTADTDTRVNPSHARKMAARMQELNTSKNPILLRTAHKAGHGFGKSKSKAIEDATYDWAFIYQQLDVKSKS